jgi:DNA-binding transcriptional LysR family regulator
MKPAFVPFDPCFEIHHLRCFIIVADELSFTRAAERLYVPPGTVIVKIQNLEKKLGNIKLFDREKRPIQLTQAGAAFLEDARSILATLERAEHKVKRIGRGDLGYLNIGFTSSMANGVLPEILQIFQRSYPEIKLIFREINSAVQIENLRNRQVDLVFVYQDFKADDNNDLKVMQLLPESLVVVLPERHPLAAKSQISISELANEKFIMPLPQHEGGLLPQIEKVFRQAQIVLNVVQEALFMVTILGLVAGEIGISILPSSVENLHRKGVVYRPLIEETSAERLNAIWRCDDSSAILSKFVRVISENFCTQA